MRQMSFALTTAQVRARTKTVTRRLGWTFLHPGDSFQPIVQGQGLKKGQRVTRIGGPCRAREVRRERLGRLLENRAYGRREVDREGFPDWTIEQFVTFFARTHRCTVHDMVTRIAYTYEE